MKAYLFLHYARVVTRTSTITLTSSLPMVTSAEASTEFDTSPLYDLPRPVVARRLAPLGWEMLGFQMQYDTALVGAAIDEVWVREVQS